MHCAGVRSNVTKGSLLRRRAFVPLFVPLKSINLFSYSLIANNKTHFSVLYQFLLFLMSLLSHSLFTIVYSHVLKNLLMDIRKVRRLNTFLNVYWRLFPRCRFEARSSNIWKKSCSFLVKLFEELELPTDSVYVVWDSLCNTVLHTHGHECFSLN